MSTLCKIIEAVKNNLMAFIVSHSLININQHGFMYSKSTCS